MGNFSLDWAGKMRTIRISPPFLSKPSGKAHARIIRSAKIAPTVIAGMIELANTQRKL
jgi:hypothetical protein